MSTRRIIFYTLLVSVWVIPCIAFGQEQPCRRVDGNVVCSNAAFKILTDRCIDAQGQAKECAVKLDAVRKDYDEAKKALDACVASIPPPPPPRSALRPALGFAAGVVGTALVAAAPLLNIDTGWQVGMGLAGVGMLAGGFILVLPMD
jgi:hypothetical protein